MQLNERITKAQHAFHVVDYLLAGIALGYGLYSQSLFWTGAGLVGLVLAYINPALRVRNRIEHNMAQRNAKQPD